MFQGTLVAQPATRQTWSFVVSLLIQALAVAGLLLVPLLNTYEIPLGDWAGRAFRLMAPPPPPPPSPPTAPVPQAAPERYQSDFTAPAAIPAKVARLIDSGPAGPPLLGVPAPQGVLGSEGVPSAGGVFGAILPEPSSLTLPPPIRVGGRVQNARILHKVQPEYPPEAVEQHVTGVVKLEAIIAVDGAVRDLKLISGHPLLAAAAIDAVSEWRYRPTHLNGRAVEVTTLVDVVFNLHAPEEQETKRRRQGGRRANRR